MAKKKKAARMGRPVNDPGIKTWVGQSLKMRRLACGWTLDGVAEHLGVGSSTVWRWERGDNAPSAKVLTELASMFECKPRDFSREPTVK